MSAAGSALARFPWRHIVVGTTAIAVVTTPAAPAVGGVPAAPDAGQVQRADTEDQRGRLVPTGRLKGEQLGWRCVARHGGTRLRCARTKKVRAGKALSLNLTLKVSPRRKVSAKKADVVRIRGTAKWRAGRAPARRDWLDTGSGTVEIQPPIGVRLVVAGDGKVAVVSDADPEARALQLTHGDQPVYFRGIRPAEVQVPRESRKVPPCSVVQVGIQPYRPAAGTYPNAEPMNPVPDGDCGLIGAFGVRPQSVKTLPIVCSQRECVADDKQFRTGGATGSLREARDQILTLLRQPPGILPPGVEIYQGHECFLKDEGSLRGLQAELRVARLPGRDPDYVLVLFSNANGTPSVVARLTELPTAKTNSIRYYLTGRGVLTSTVEGGGSIGQNAALDKAPAPESQPVLALVGQEIVVYCGSTQDSGVLWTYGKSGCKKVKDCKPAA